METPAYTVAAVAAILPSKSPVLARAGSPALAAGGCTAAPGFLALCGWKVRCCSYSLTPQPGWLSTRLESTQPAEELL